MPGRGQQPPPDAGDVPLEGLQRWAAPTLRVSLAAVFIWFGVLKLIGNSPVKAMIAATLPWLDAGIGVPALGAVEVALGIALMTRWLPRLTLIGLAAHLSGTFLTFLVAPDLMMQHGNPLLLTAAGEFVIKNFVLLSAALVLLAQTAGRNHRRRPAADRPPDPHTARLLVGPRRCSNPARQPRAAAGSRPRR